MRATVIKRLNKRNFPSAEGNLPLPNPHEPGDIIEVVEELKGAVVKGTTNDRWFKTDKGYFLWSGGLSVGNNLNLSFFDNEVEFGRPINFWVDFFEIPKLWKPKYEKKVRVCILDTGLDEDHPDLVGVLGISQNFIAPGKKIEDFQGHGTHCAGILAGNGSLKIKGISPYVILNVGKILHQKINGINEKILFKAIKWAGDNSDIISISAGIPNPNKEISDLIEEFTKNGKIFISAIGNLETLDNHSFGDFPATDSNVISVGSCTNEFELSSFTKRFPNLDICAPGENILSTYTRTKATFSKDSGSSMATPFIAGLVSLLYQSRGKIDIQIARDWLKSISEEKCINNFTYNVLKPTPIGL